MWGVPKVALASVASPSSSNQMGGGVWKPQLMKVDSISLLLPAVWRQLPLTDCHPGWDAGWKVTNRTHRQKEEEYHRMLNFCIAFITMFPEEKLL